MSSRPHVSKAPSRDDPAKEESAGIKTGAAAGCGQRVVTGLFFVLALWLTLNAVMQPSTPSAGPTESTGAGQTGTPGATQIPSPAIRGAPNASPTTTPTPRKTNLPASSVWQNPTLAHRHNDCSLHEASLSPMAPQQETERENLSVFISEHVKPSLILF